MTQPLSPHDSTHASLLHRLAKQPDANAWEEFHARYGELILNYCMRTGRFRVEPDELLQEVFQALLKALPKFTYCKAKGGFRPYLWRVTVNKAIELSKRQQAQPGSLSDHAVDGIEHHDGPDEIWESEWMQYHFRGAFEQLRRENSPSKMAVFEKYALLNTPVDDVATEHDCSVDMVYKTKSLIMERLSEIVDMRIREEG